MALHVRVVLHFYRATLRYAGAVYIRWPEIFIWGLQLEGLGYRSPHWGAGTKPRQGRSPSEAEVVYRHCLQILATERIKIWKFPHNLVPDSSPVCYSVEAKRHLAPSPCLALPLRVTMPSFPFTLYGECCRPHFVGQQIVINIGVIRGCWGIARLYFESNNTNLSLRLLIDVYSKRLFCFEYQTQLALQHGGVYLVTTDTPLRLIYTAPSFNCRNPKRAFHFAT